MYVERNVEELSCNHCCSGTAISIKYYECVFVALGIKNVMRMRQIVICVLSCPTMLFHVISQTARFSKIKTLFKFKPVLISSINLVWNIAIYGNKWARYDQKRISVFMSITRYFCHILIKL